MRLGKYYLLFFTDRIPAWAGGRAIGPVLQIREKYKNDKGLLEHEKTHARQWWRTLGIHSIFYKWDRAYRLFSEVEAYRIQLRYSPGAEAVFAGFLATRYGLDITPAAAEKMLRGA